MRKIAIIGVAVLVVVTFLAGFWPQHRRLTESQDQVRSLQEHLTAAESRVRLGEILGQLLHLSDAVRGKNFGQAATLSSAFFDAVRQDVARANPPEATNTLNGILHTRDRVTTPLPAPTPGSSRFCASTRGAAACARLADKRSLLISCRNA